MRSRAGRGGCTFRLGKRNIVAALAMVLGLQAATPPAGAIEAFSGACAMTIKTELSSGRLVVRMPTSTTKGTCVVTVGSVISEGTLAGHFDPVNSSVPFTCAQAVGSGPLELRIYIGEDQFSFPVTATVTVAAGVMEIAFFRLHTNPWEIINGHVIGTASFVQTTPNAVDGCTTGTSLNAVWTGGLVWEDPVLAE